MDGVVDAYLHIGGVGPMCWQYVELQLIDAVAAVACGEGVVVDACVTEFFASEIVALYVANSGFGLDDVGWHSVEYQFVDTIAALCADEGVGIDARLGENFASEVVLVAFADEGVLAKLVGAIDRKV